MSVATASCRLAVTAEEFEVHHRIRHTVFVAEQGLFEGTDRDEHDLAPTVQHVLGFVDGVPAGTVRLYRTPSLDADEVLWKGDRLAVLPEFRHAGIGAPLVQYAVAAGGAAGGHRMIAFIQQPNVVFFRRLGWTTVGEPIEYVGEPHQQMTIGLGAHV